MKIYFTADLHLSHYRITNYRTQFTTQEEHDLTIVNNVLSCGGKRNHIYLLGDTFFHSDSFKYLDMIAKNFARVIIVGGNHCSIELFRYASQFENVFFVGCMVKYNMWISHMPVHPDELYGKCNLHGHTHNKVINDPRYLCVSLEQTEYKPVTLEYVRNRL